MPRYDYECTGCGFETEIVHHIRDFDDGRIFRCEHCGCVMKTVIKEPRNTFIRPQHQACGSQFKYRGIDPITGKGVK